MKRYLISIFVLAATAMTLRAADVTLESLDPRSISTNGAPPHPIYVKGSLPGTAGDTFYITNIFVTNIVVQFLVSSNATIGNISGTLGTMALFTPNGSSLGNSIVTQQSTNSITVDGPGVGYVVFGPYTNVLSTDGTNPTWNGVPIGGGGGFINPTDTFIPYRSNATTFADSPLFTDSGGNVTYTNLATPDGYTVFSPGITDIHWSTNSLIDFATDASDAGFSVNFTDSTNGFWGIGANVAVDDAFQFGAQGPLRPFWLFKPAHINGSVTDYIYTFDTEYTQTQGLIFKVQNSGTNQFGIDASSTAHDTRLLLWDVDKDTLSRVSVGTNDSGGAGFKVLRVPN